MPEEKILVADPEHAFVDQTDGTVVTGQHVVIDGASDKEAVSLSPWAGASSTAAPNSGVPSAQTQQGIKNIGRGADDSTPIADRFNPDGIDPQT